MDSKASDAVSDEPVAIYEMFPSDEGTKFGDWVKAGALQPGDKVSIRKGIDAVSGDKIVTVKSITKDNSAKRVYNLEIESLDGENTHNYFIGEDELWVHNGRGRRGPRGKCKKVYIDGSGSATTCDAPTGIYRDFCHQCACKMDPDELEELSGSHDGSIPKKWGRPSDYSK